MTCVQYWDAAFHISGQQISKLRRRNHKIGPLAIMKVWLGLRVPRVLGHSEYRTDAWIAIAVDIRVTRFGEFSPFGLFFISGNLLKNAQLCQIFALHFAVKDQY
jgi:hypothetical protein